MKKKLILITLTSLMSLMAWVMPVLANTVTSPTPVGVELTTPNSTADSPMVYGDNINYNQALTGIYFHANLAKGDTIRVKWYWQGSISDPQNGNFLTQNDFSPTNGDSNFMSGLFTAPSGAYSVQLELITGSGATDSYAYFTEVDNALGNIALFPALTPTGGGSTRGAPSPVSATDNGSGTISWPANPTSDNVTGYNVYSDGSLVATVTSPSFNYSSLPAGTHSITVTALNSLGESTPSTPVSVTSGTGSTGGIGGTGNDTGCSDVVNAVNALGSQLATIITNQGTLATDISNLGNQLTTVTDSQTAIQTALTNIGTQLGQVSTSLGNLTNYVTTPTQPSPLNTSSLGTAPTFDPSVPDIPGEPQQQPYVYSTPAPQLPSFISSPSALPSIPEPSIMPHDTPTTTITPLTPQTPTASQTPVASQAPLTISSTTMDPPLTQSVVQPSTPITPQAPLATSTATMDPPLTPSVVQKTTPISPQAPILQSLPYAMQPSISPQ